MGLTPDVRARKIREVAGRHGWTTKRAEEQVASFKSRLNIPEEELFETLLEMKPELLQKPS